MWSRYTSLAEANGIGKTLVDYSKYDLTPVMLGRQSVGDRGEAARRWSAFLRGLAARGRAGEEGRGRKGDAGSSKITSRARASTSASKAVKLLLSKLDVTPDFMPEVVDYLNAEAQILRGQQADQGEMPDWNARLDISLLNEARKNRLSG